MKKLLTAITFIVLSCIGIACSSDAKPDSIIDEETYVKLIVENQLIRSYLSNTRDTVGYNMLIDSVYAKYNCTIEQFDLSHLWYEKDFEAQKKRFEKARKYFVYIAESDTTMFIPDLEASTNYRFD